MPDIDMLGHILGRETEPESHSPPSEESYSQMPRFVPPLNFAHVEQSVYRSGQPTPLNFPFLDTLGLKTVVWLSNDEPSDAFQSYCDDRELIVHHFMGLVDGGSPWDPITEQCVTHALTQIIDINNWPVLVCCGMGRHRTGTVVGCLRRLQGWSLSAALEEYRRYTGSRRTRIVNELAIEAFQRDSVQLPPLALLPWWLCVTTVVLEN